MKMLQRYHDLITGGPNGFGAGAQPVDITPAAQWYISEDQRIWIDVRDDFPNLAPPWPVTWMEFNPPTRLRNGQEVYEIPKFVRRMPVGALIHGFRIIDEEDARMKILTNDEHLRWVNKCYHFGNLSDSMASERNRALSRAGHEGNLPRWIIAYDVLFEVPGIGLVPDMHCSLLADDQGMLIDGSLLSTEWQAHIPIGGQADDRDSMSHVHVFMFAVSLLHCKNVKLEDIRVPLKVQRARDKRGVPRITFKTLVVEPLRQQVRKETVDDPNGEQNHIKRALHIARGHFNDYRDGGGLFGKYQGLYWWDMHIRGSADAGIIAKDYELRR